MPVRKTKGGRIQIPVQKEKHIMEKVQNKKHKDKEEL